MHMLAEENIKGQSTEGKTEGGDNNTVQQQRQAKWIGPEALPHIEHQQGAGEDASQKTGDGVAPKETGKIVDLGALQVIVIGGSMDK